MTSTPAPAENANLQPKCVAQDDGMLEAVASKRGLSPNTTNYFKAVHFSVDGSTLVTLSEDQILRTFILPADLLDETKQPHKLNPHAQTGFATNIQSYTLYPYFHLADPSTTLVLCANNDVPIALRNALHYDTVVAKYLWINPTTEAYTAARSVAITRQGTAFIAGGDNTLAIFDISRNGSGPIVSHQLRHGRKSTLRNSSTMTRKGVVSALSVSAEGTLAIGTLQQEIGLYDDEGSGDCISTFCVAPPWEDRTYQGTGVTCVKWSPCGKYLLTAERQSDCVMVYDVRDTQRRVAILTGRRAVTTQKMGIDVVPTANGYEVWAGGTDGSVRMWANPGSTEGLHAPDAELKLHGSAVAGAVWHPSGSILATCSGERAWASLDDDSDDDSNDDEAGARPPPDNSLKFWTL